MEDLSRLMDAQVDLEDQVYSYQLDSALHSERRAWGGARQDEGFWTLPIEEVLPAPAHIPESFRGKTWAQIEQEDEEKVDKLVQQFRRERFICYFDSESLARYTHLYCVCFSMSNSKHHEGPTDQGVLQVHLVGCHSTTKRTTKENTCMSNVSNPELRHSCPNKP